MGYSFLEFMKRIGIFIICAQSFLHFTAGKSYEKYVKLLIGLMILAQFTVPVRAVFLAGENTELWEEVERFQEELEEMEADITWDYQEENGLTAALGEEVKEKLEGIAKEYGFEIEGVEVCKEPPKIEVVVVKKQGGEVIRVDKIEVISGEEIGQRLAGADFGHENMKKEFAAALHTDEEYIEIKEE
ncbi:hypothetical protein D3Z45_08060 [Lachnospiraceae bacterium]|nr:hypothetical protein [Lachnospiraceae bacterium]